MLADAKGWDEASQLDRAALLLSLLWKNRNQSIVLLCLLSVMCLSYPASVLQSRCYFCCLRVHTEPQKRPHTLPLSSSQLPFIFPSLFSLSLHLLISLPPPSHPFQSRWKTLELHLHYWPVDMMPCSHQQKSTLVISSQKRLAEVKKKDIRLEA